jgi:hypothetical protein
VVRAVDERRSCRDPPRCRLDALQRSRSRGGGEEAIGSLAADDRIRAVVAEGATARTSTDKSWLSEEFGVRGWFQEQLEWLQYSLVDVLTAAPTPRSLASSVVDAQPRQVLMITAGEVTDEERAARHIRSASPSTVQIWTVPGASHTGGLSTEPAAWQRTALAFLDEHLAEIPS